MTQFDILCLLLHEKINYNVFNDFVNRHIVFGELSEYGSTFDSIDHDIVENNSLSKLIDCCDNGTNDVEFHNITLRNVEIITSVYKKEDILNLEWFRNWYLDNTCENCHWEPGVFENLKIIIPKESTISEANLVCSCLQVLNHFYTLNGILEKTNTTIDYSIIEESKFDSLSTISEIVNHHVALEEKSIEYKKFHYLFDSIVIDLELHKLMTSRNFFCMSGLLQELKLIGLLLSNDSIVHNNQIVSGIYSDCPEKILPSSLYNNKVLSLHKLILRY